MSVRQSSDSIDYFQVTITTALANPTGDSVEMAFVAPGVVPVDADWVPADWVPDTEFTAQRLVYGATADPSPPVDATVLDVGPWIVWVRVHDNPEVPVRQADQLVIY